MEAQIDVVIPVHDRLDWLRLCVQALHTWTSAPWRLVLVDNASEQPETKRWLVDLERQEEPWPEGTRCVDLRVVRLGQNRSFANAVNAGARAGDAPHLVLLNSDVIVTQGWDGHLLQDLANPHVGLAGARTNAASGLQGAGVSPGLIAPRWLIFCCVGMRREVYEEVGGLDERTFPDWCGGEDVDYSWAVRKAGYELALSEAWVYHGGSQTYRSTVGAFGVQEAMHQRAEARLRSKWGREHYRAERRTFPRVALCTLSGEGMTSCDFAQAFRGLRAPGPFQVEVFWAQRAVVHVAREQIVDAVLAAEDPFDHLLFVDDDMLLPPTALAQLLVHGKQFVGALCYQRNPPHTACAYDWHEDLEGHVTIGSMAHGAGLRRVDAIGFGCVLIATDLLRALPKPRFQYTVGKGGMGEDIGFCRAARLAGHEVWCDTDLVVPHLGGRAVVDQAYVERYEASRA